MVIEQHNEETLGQYESNIEHNNIFSRKCKSISEPPVATLEDNSSGGFDCNICLESVQEPVVTLCGHLYCWPCIYKWLHVQTMSTEYDDDPKQPECPVCKAKVLHTTLVPLYSRGQTTKSPKPQSVHLGIVTPRRPLGPSHDFHTPRLTNPTSSSRSVHQLHHHNYQHHSQNYYPHRSVYSPGSLTNNMFDPVLGMFGEMIYARMFGSPVTNLYTYPNSYNLTGNSSPRVRRHVMEADKSLSRICFFLLCCVLLCLLLF